MKKSCALYDHLTATGLLETGNAHAIAQAKKAYWADIRKAWKAQQRKEKKGHTVFLTEEEVSRIRKIVGTQRSGVTGYIKQATLATISNLSPMDKKIIGEVRAHLYGFYNTVIEQTTQNNIPEKAIEQLLDEIEVLQQNILSSLQTHKV